MRMEHLVYLACPRCGGSLSLLRRLLASRMATSYRDRSIARAATLATRSSKASRDYSPTGLFCRASARTVAARFGYEWNRFCDFDYDEEVASLRTWFQPRRLEDLSGLVLLEAGCGMGRHAVIAANQGAKTVIGLDLGNAVEAAFQNTRHLPSVSIVQGDIYFPPFKDGTFDAAYSLGVLHHLPEPSRGFRALAPESEKRRLVPGLGVRTGRKWLDHLYHQPDPVRDFANSARHSQCPFAGCSPCRCSGSPKTLYRIPWLSNRLPYSAYIRWLASFSIRKVHAIVLDHALTPVAHYMSRADV